MRPGRSGGSPHVNNVVVHQHRFSVDTKLKEAGAVDVCGVTLARQPWRK